MKTSLPLLRAAEIGGLSALVVLFAGCASAPLRQSTEVMDYEPSPLVAEMDGHAFARPIALQTVQPEHPYDLRRAGITGLVTVNCAIDETGKVTDAQVESSTDPWFEEPALEAVKKWTFKPATQDGVAVASRASIPIRFELDD